MGHDVDHCYWSDGAQTFEKCQESWWKASTFSVKTNEQGHLLRVSEDEVECFAQTLKKRQGTPELGNLRGDFRAVSRA